MNSLSDRKEIEQLRKDNLKLKAFLNYAMGYAQYTNLKSLRNEAMRVQASLEKKTIFLSLNPAQ
jgi:hypothetical protein